MITLPELHRWNRTADNNVRVQWVSRFRRWILVSMLIIKAYYWLRLLKCWLKQFLQWNSLAFINEFKCKKLAISKYLWSKVETVAIIDNMKVKGYNLGNNLFTEGIEQYLYRYNVILLKSVLVSIRMILKKVKTF